MLRVKQIGNSVRELFIVWLLFRLDIVVAVCAREWRTLLLPRGYINESVNPRWLRDAVLYRENEHDESLSGCSSPFMYDSPEYREVRKEALTLPRADFCQGLCMSDMTLRTLANHFSTREKTLTWQRWRSQSRLEDSLCVHKRHVRDLCIDVFNVIAGPPRAAALL